MVAVRAAGLIGGRRRRVALVLALLTAAVTVACGAAPDGAEPALEASDDGRLVLMTLNADFLWDGVLPEDGDVQFERRGDREAARRHMASIAGIVRQYDPDIVQLLEIENERALVELRDDHLSDRGYEVYFVQGMDTATGQDIGLLSRHEPLTVGRDPRRGQSGSTRKAVSKQLVVRIDVGSLRLGLVGVHLLADPTSRSRKPRREAQADAVRGIAVDLSDQGRSVIVWGDFNDFDGAVLDRRGNRPITDVLERVRAMDPNDPDDDLWNVAERLPTDDRSTHLRGDAIDHVLVGPRIRPLIEAVEIGNRWPDDPPTPHAPIVVTLRVPSG